MKKPQSQKYCILVVSSIFLMLLATFLTSGDVIAGKALSAQELKSHLSKIAVKIAKASGTRDIGKYGRWTSKQNKVKYFKEAVEKNSRKLMEIKRKYESGEVCSPSDAPSLSEDELGPLEAND